jgi:CHAD domain-containing protein
VESLHELRKRAKDLWYAAQLLQAARPKRAKTIVDRAHELSDLLGSDHDLAILRERAVGDPSLEPAELEQLEKLIDRRREHLRREALSSAERLYRRKPRKVARRLALG